MRMRVGYGMNAVQAQRADKKDMYIQRPFRLTQKNLTSVGDVISKPERQLPEKKK